MQWALQCTSSTLMQQQLAAAAKTIQAQGKLRLASAYPLGMQQMQQQPLLPLTVRQGVWMVQQGQQQLRAGCCVCWRCTWTAALTWR
jgi:hypothetical protein